MLRNHKMKMKMKKDGDILLELIGLSADNEKAISILKNWNI